MFRSLQRKEEVGFAQAFSKSLHHLRVALPDGRIGQLGAYNVDLRRLYRTIGRIVRGLYLHNAGEALPGEFEVWTRFDQDLEEMIGEGNAKRSFSSRSGRWLPASLETGLSAIARTSRLRCRG